MAEKFVAVGSCRPIADVMSDPRCPSHGRAKAMDALKNLVGAEFDPSCVTEKVVDGETPVEKRVQLTYTPKAVPRADKPAGKGKGKAKAAKGGA